MRKKLLILFSCIGSLVLILAIVLGILFVPRSLMTFLGISADEIDQIYLEVGFDEKKQYFLADEYKESFCKDLKKIHVVPTYNNTKFKTSVLMVIQTKKNKYTFNEYYYYSDRNSRKEFILMDNENYENLYSLFPDFSWDEYLDSI